MPKDFKLSPLALAIGSSLAISSTQAAVITVDTNDGIGQASNCSLRSAVESINSQSAVDSCDAGDGDNDTIVFDDSVTGSIVLADYGRLNIDAPMTITGPGAGELTLDMQSVDTLFLAYDNLNLSGLTLTGGSYYYGGAVSVTPDATVSLSDCVITGNNANALGGGVEVYRGALFVDNCTFSDNTAAEVGGGIAVTFGTAEITNSTFTGNTAQNAGGSLSVTPNDAGPTPEGLIIGTSRLELVDSVVTESSAQVGGGIFAGQSYYGGPKSVQGALGGGDLEPNLIVTNSQISNNSAVYGGGITVLSPAPVRPEGEPLPPPGGDVGSKLVLTGSEVSDNVASLDGGGIALTQSSARIIDSQITGNLSADGGGGGILFYAEDDTVANSLYIRGSQIDGNSAEVDEYSYGIGGGLLALGGITEFIESSADNNTAAAGYGGGVASLYGDSLLFGASVSGNSGGGVHAKYGSQTLVFSRVDGNQGEIAGGISCVAGAECQVNYSSVTNNTGASVGGIGTGLADGPVPVGSGPSGSQTQGGLPSIVTVFSSTVSGNSGGQVGGILANQANLAHSTVAFNSQQASGETDTPSGLATQAGGLSISADASSLDHSIVSDNSSVDGPGDIFLLDSGTLAVDYSLIGDATGLDTAGSGNLLDVDAELEALANNGGDYATLTHALAPTSPAITGGDPDIASAPAFDQRGPGFDRIIDGTIDIGAFEAEVTGDGPAVALSDIEIDFNDVVVGDTETSMLTISSAGDADLELGAISLPPSPAGTAPPFTIVQDDCSNQTLAPTESCDIEIEFQPDASVVFSDTLTIPSNAPSSPDEVELTGRGVAPALSIVPASIDFGSIELGDPAAPGTVELENVGDANLELGTISLLSSPAGTAPPFTIVQDECSNQTLAPAESCDIEIEFQPDERAVFSDTLTIPSNAPSSPDEVELTGRGIAPELSIVPTSIDFGSIELGDAAVPGSVELENTGDAPLELSSVDNLAAPFALAGGDCTIPGNLAAGAVCELGFEFAPTAAGSFSQTVSVTSNALAGNDSVVLEGEAVEGTEPPPPPPPPSEAIPVPVMSQVATGLLAGGLLLLGWLGLRRSEEKAE